MYRSVPGPREGWLYLVLLLAVVLSPALSLADSAWVDNLEVVPWLAFISVLLGFALAKLPVRAPLAHVFALEVGIATVAALFANLSEEKSWNEKLVWLWERIWAWLVVVFGGGMSNDTMLFALTMSLTAWFLGYLAGWAAFRRHVVWPVLVICGTALLVNLSYGGPNQLVYFLVFVMSSMLLLSRLTLFEKQRDWDTSSADYTPGVTFGFLWRSSLLSVIVMAAAWAMPTGSVAASVAEGWYQITTPWHGLQVEFDRIFASVGTSGRLVEGNRFSNTLALKGAIELGDEPVMLVSSPVPEYWGARTYDRYTGQGWMSSASQTSRLEAGDPQLLSGGNYGARQQVEQQFKPLVGGVGSIFAGGVPIKVSVPTYADHFDTLDLVSALRPTVPLRRGQQYGVIASVSVAGAVDLRAAGTDYPAWTDRYLDLPSYSLRRVRSLARQITRDANNPYDAAVAIERHLRDFQYSVDVPAPPPNRDAVDWFLFVSREGYCDYFASGMAVMARTLGIPSRVVSGYNTGTFSEETGLYTVRQENAHSWPELFFPGYGWVRFEPTPSQPVPVRPEESPAGTIPASDELTAEDLAALSLDFQDPDSMLLEDELVFGEDGGFTNSAPRPAPWTFLIIPAILATAILLLWLMWRRLASSLTDSGRAYLQLYSVAGLLGWRLRPSNTPGEYGRMLGEASPELRSEMDTVVRSYMEEVYGGRRSPDGEAIRESWRRLRAKLPLHLLKQRLSRR